MQNYCPTNTNTPLSANSNVSASKSASGQTATVPRTVTIPIRRHIVDVLGQKAVCELEELVHVSPSYTWNQIFFEVDRLSRTGELRLVSVRPGVYAITLPTE